MEHAICAHWNRALLKPTSCATDSTNTEEAVGVHSGQLTGDGLKLGDAEHSGCVVCV